MTPEAFKEQFGRRGYLAEIMDVFTRNLRVKHMPWFVLVADTNETLQAIAVKSMEQYSGLLLGDKKVLATLLLLRSLGLFQGSVMLVERGMIVEGRVLMRALLETSFCLGAIHDDAQAFVNKFSSDHEKSRRQQAEAAIQFGSLDPSSEQFKALTDAINAISKSEKFLNMSELAKEGPLSRLFLLYKVMSNDSAHCSVTSALNHYERSDQVNCSAGYILGPYGADQAELNLDNLILIATSIGIGFTNIVGDVGGNRQVSGLCKRYEALRNGSNLDR